MEKIRMKYVAMVAGFIAGSLIVSDIRGFHGRQHSLEEAMDRGYAIHCPEDGVLRWKDECATEKR